MANHQGESMSARKSESTCKEFIGLASSRMSGKHTPTIATARETRIFPLSSLALSSKNTSVVTQSPASKYLAINHTAQKPVMSTEKLSPSHTNGIRSFKLTKGVK